MGLRTDRGLIVLNIAEVLPMVSDVLTVLSFVVFCMTKALPVISQMVKGVILLNEAHCWLIPAVSLDLSRVKSVTDTHSIRSSIFQLKSRCQDCSF